MLCGSMPCSAAARQASASPSITFGGFHETEIKQHAGDAGADRHQLDALLTIYPRLISCDDGDQQHALVQDAVMSQVMRQGEWYAGARGREDCRRAGQADGWR